MRFAINFLPDRQLISVERWGFYDVNDARRYGGELIAAVKTAEASGRPFDIVIDITRAETMPRDAAEAMALIAADVEASRAGRIAYVGSGAIKTMQVRRLVGNPERFQVFETVEAAQSWLAEGRERVD